MRYYKQDIVNALSPFFKYEYNYRNKKYIKTNTRTKRGSKVLPRITFIAQVKN